MGMMKNDFTLSRADSALLARDFSLAARLYRLVLKDDPTNVDVLFKLGSTYIKANQDDKAETAYTAILKTDPENFAALNSLGGIYRRLGKYSESIQVLEKALHIRHTTDVLYNLGFTYKLMEDYNSAAECFVDVIDENPDDVLAYNHLGTIMAKRGDHKKALQTYWKGLQVDQNHPVLHYNSALSYVALGNTAEARNSFENALRVKPGWPDAMEGLAELYIQDSKYPEAQDLMTQALKINPENDSLLMTQGRLHEYRENYPDAENVFRNLLEKKPEDYSVMSHLENVYEKENRFEEALSLLSRMKAKQGSTKELDKKHIKLLIDQGNTAEAGSMLDKARVESPDDVDYLNLLAQYFVRTEQDDKANGCYKRISELRPGSVRCLKDSAEQYIRMGQYDKAEEFLSKYLKMHPDNGEALRRLGEVYERQERYQDSLGIYKSVLEKDKDNTGVLAAVSRVGTAAGNNKKTMSMVSNILSEGSSENSTDDIQEKIRLYEDSIGSMEKQPKQDQPPVDYSVGQDIDSCETIDFDDFLRLEYSERDRSEDEEVFTKLAMEDYPVDFESEEFDDNRQAGRDSGPHDMPYEYTGSRDEFPGTRLEYQSPSLKGPMEQNEFLDVSGSDYDPEDDYFQEPKPKAKPEPVPVPVEPQYPRYPEPKPQPYYPPKPEPEIKPEPVQKPVPMERPSHPLTMEADPEMPLSHDFQNPELVPEMAPPEPEFVPEYKDAPADMNADSFDPAEEMLAEDGAVYPEPVEPEEPASYPEPEPVSVDPEESLSYQEADENGLDDLIEDNVPQDVLPDSEGPVEEDVSNLDDLFEADQPPIESSLEPELEEIPEGETESADVPELESEEEPVLDVSEPEPDEGNMSDEALETLESDGADAVDGAAPEMTENGELPAMADDQAPVATLSGPHEDAKRNASVPDTALDNISAPERVPEKHSPAARDEKTTMDLVGNALKTACPVTTRYTFKDAADMFRTLRKLTDSLKPVQKEAFVQSLHKQKLDYVIERLSSRPGLLAAATAIRKTGGIAGLEVKTKPSLLKTMTYIRTLTDNLPDKKKGGLLKQQMDRVINNPEMQ